MKTYDQFDVITVPFPFTDSHKTKKRPALVLSSSKEFSSEKGHCICAMITSEKNSPWPLDIIIQNLMAAGLPAPSRIRMKLFTIDSDLIEKKIGSLGKKDLLEIKNNLNKLFSLNI